MLLVTQAIVKVSVPKYVCSFYIQTGNRITSDIKFGCVSRFKGYNIKDLRILGYLLQLHYMFFK